MTVVPQVGMLAGSYRSGSEPGASHSTGHRGLPEIVLKPAAPATEKHYLGIRYDPGMFSSRVARTAPFAFASLLK